MVVPVQERVRRDVDPTSAKARIARPDTPVKVDNNVAEYSKRDRMNEKEIEEKEQERIYSLKLTSDMYEALSAAAQARHTTVANLLRAFIKLGLLALAAEEDPNTDVIIRKGDRDQYVVLV